jgi:hypothetical protein
MLYILKLQQNNFLVHFGETKSDEEIMIECEIYYDFAKTYKPLLIVEKKILVDYFDIDKTVKQYMYLYGYYNVRGGSYIDEILPEYLEKTLNEELDFVEREELDWSYSLKEIIDKYLNQEYTMDEIDMEISKIKQQCIKYKIEKEKYEKTNTILINGEKKQMKFFLTEDIEWLYTFCGLNSESTYVIDHTQIENRLKSKNVNKYKLLLVYFKKIYEIFKENDLFLKFNIEETIYLKYPIFLFDGFIYNTFIKDIDNLSKTCKMFEFMGNIIINMINELEYDVISYGNGYEWKYSRMLYILEKKREKI